MTLASIEFQFVGSLSTEGRLCFAELKNQMGVCRLSLRSMKLVRERFFLAAAQNIRRLEAMIGRECVLPLCGGDKQKQSADIERALEYLKDYEERSGIS